MTFTAATAAGTEAAAALEAFCRAQETGSTGWLRDREFTVAWSMTSPWVQVHSGPDAVVVLDGRLHNQPANQLTAPEWLLQRYRADGIRFAEGVLGDFVALVLDRVSRELLVARDPLGVRPWYTALRGSECSGASELATLVDLPGIDTSLNETVAVEFLAGRRQSRGATFYTGVSTLAHGATNAWRGGSTRLHRHHTWSVQPEGSLTWDDAVDRCRSVLDDAVRCRVADALPTSQLSGGLDSSSIVGTIARMGLPQLAGARLLFASDRADERRYSDAVIEHWGIESISAPPWLPTDEEAHDMMRQFRRPPPDPNFTMFGLLNQEMVGRGRRNSLTGLGGDDAFLVQPESHLLVSAVQLRRPMVFGALARTAVRHPRYVWYRILKPTARYLRPARVASPRGWITQTASAQARLPSLFGAKAKRVTGVTAIDERLNGVVSGAVAAALADVALFSDSLGIRHSHPFLDPRVIEATYGLDPWWPLKNGHERALEVAAFADRLPPLVVQRRSKAEFSEVVWPQSLTEAAIASVLTGPVRDYEWLDSAGFTELVEHARQRRPFAALPLSRCVALDRWLRGR